MKIFQLFKNLKLISIIKKEGFISFFNRILVKSKRLILMIPLIYKITKMTKTYKIESLYNFVLMNGKGMIYTKQVKSEIIRLLNILRKQNLRFILEIGTLKGGTLFLLSKISSKNALIISLDLPGGKYGGGYSILKTFLYKSFALHQQKIHLIRANSHHKSTLKIINKILGSNKLDLLFIDGDHTYEGVKKDFNMYYPLVKKSGIIALHDIVPHSIESEVKVFKFWNEIKDKFDYEEIIEDWDQKWAGIGILIN